MPRISPGANIEADAIEHAPPAAAADRVEREIAHRKDRRARARPRTCGGSSATSRPTIAEMIAPGERPSIGGGQDAPAVAQHGDPIGEREDFVDAVRGVDDRDARRRELAHDLEQRLAFRRRKSRGRLVHDQNARVERQRLGDLDQLLLADAQLGDAALRRRCRCRAASESAFAALTMRRRSTIVPTISGSRPRKMLSAAVSSGTRLSS